MTKELLPSIMHFAILTREKSDALKKPESNSLAIRKDRINGKIWQIFTF